MKPATSTMVHTDNLPGEEIEFGIGDPRWIMRTQARLYSDVVTAIIREYSTNAYDAHVMAGNPDPIKVTLPSPMNKFFVVEDKGVGMDMDVFRKTYTQFGVSPKRGDNTTNGMLGYGSKSGVAYTDKFSVVSVRNGHKIEGVIQRRPDWSIVLKVVKSYRTDEPNGTTITIPVHNVEEFNHKAKEFYKFWLPGRVLVNGTEPVHAVGNKITDNLYYSQHWATSYVVMGNVPYRIANPSALFTNSKMKYVNFVAYVDDFKAPNGEQPVEFTPSREDLEYTERTKSTLQQVMAQFEHQIITTAQNEINHAATHADAYTAWAKWCEVLGREMFKNLSFKGDTFQSEFDFNGYRYNRNSSHNSVQTISRWGVESMANTMVVTEFDISMSSAVKQKAKQYASLKGWSVNYILFTAKGESSVQSKWIHKDKFVKWADLKAAIPKQPKKPSSGVSNHPNAGRVSGSWDYFTLDGYFTEKPLPADKTQLLYVTVRDEKRVSVNSLVKSLGLSNLAVLIVPANRLDKLLRENPNIKPLMPFAKSKVVKDGPSLLTDDAKEILGLSDSTKSWLSGLDADRLDDPEILRLKSLMAKEDELTERYHDNENLARLCGMWYDVTRFRPEAESNYLFNTYPLLSSLTRYGSRINVDNDHLYMYMNAAYAAETENNNE